MPTRQRNERHHRPPRPAHSTPTLASLTLPFDLDLSRAAAAAANCHGDNRGNAAPHTRRPHDGREEDEGVCEAGPDELCVDELEGDAARGGDVCVTQARAGEAVGQAWVAARGEEGEEVQDAADAGESLNGGEEAGEAAAGGGGEAVVVPGGWRGGVAWLVEEAGEGEGVDVRGDAKGWEEEALDEG